MVSAVLLPLQAASWLISILEGLGAVPSNFTVPLTDATVLGSMGVAAGAGCAIDEGEEDWDSFVASFLLQPSRSQRPRRQSKPNIAMDVFLFIMSPFLEVLKALLKVLSFRFAAIQKFRSKFAGATPTPRHLDGSATKLSILPRTADACALRRRGII